VDDEPVFSISGVAYDELFKLSLNDT